MALTASSIGSGSGTASSWTSASFTCSAGDLLIVGVTVGNNDAAQLISSVSDDSGSGTWVMLGEANSSVFDAKWWYKIANGSETTVTTTFTSSWAYDAVAAKVTGWTNTATLEDVDEDTSYLTTATTTSIGGGSVTNATASAMALMFVANDGSSLMDAGRSVSDGASYSEVVTSGAQIFLWAHAKSSTGTYSPVYSFTDTGDQAYGASAVFGDASGSGSLNVSATTDALTLAEYAATVSYGRNVAATTDALTLTECPATLSFALNVSCNTATLILAEYSATVSSGETSRPLGLSPWLDLDTETTDTRRDRIRRDRERMGILAPEAVPAPEKPQERAKRPSKPIAEGNAFAPPAEPVARSANATRQVLSLADARAQKEADAARILAVLEFEAEQRRLKAIRYRTALLLLAAEA